MAKLHVVAVFTLLGFSAFAQEPKPVIPDSISVAANVAYSQYKETVLDIMQTKQSSSGKRPGVIAIHGGGWVGGSKDQYGARVCARYVEKGFVCVSVEYRLAKA